MKSIVLAIAAAASMTAIAAPSAAQPYRGQPAYEQDYRGAYDAGRYNRDSNYRSGRFNESHLTSGYVDGLFWKLDNAVAEGRISRGHAQQLKRELRQVQELGHPVETGQASRWERQRLAQTVARIDDALYGRGGERRGGYRRY